MGVAVSRVGECTCCSSLRLMECVSCDRQLFVGKPSPLGLRVTCEGGGSNELGVASEGIRQNPHSGSSPARAPRWTWTLQVVQLHFQSELGVQVKVASFKWFGGLCRFNTIETAVREYIPRRVIQIVTLGFRSHVLWAMCSSQWV